MVTEIQKHVSEWYYIVTVGVKSIPGTLCIKCMSDNGQWPTK